MPTPIDRLLECHWVVPVEPAGVVLEDHAIAIEGGRIRDVLPIDAARTRYAADEVVRLPHHAVTPGLVNAHTHAAMTLLRGVGDDLPLMRWLQERIWPLEGEFVSERFVYDGTRLAAHEMLRAGVTCCSDMYFFPEAAAAALRTVGMRCATGIIVIEFPSAYATDADDYLRKGLAMRDRFKDDPLVSFTLAPHAPYTVSDETFARVATLAEELDLPIHMHVHETADEIDKSLGQHGVRPLTRLDRLNLVTERLVAVHAVHLDDAAQQGHRRVRVCVHQPRRHRMVRQAYDLVGGVARARRVDRQHVANAAALDGDRVVLQDDACGLHRDDPVALEQAVDGGRHHGKAPRRSACRARFARIENRARRGLETYGATLNSPLCLPVARARATSPGAVPSPLPPLQDEHGPTR